MASNKELCFQILSPRLREEEPLPFPPEEYEERWRRVRKGMAAAGIDTLWVSDPADMCYLTGYQSGWYHDLGPHEWVPASGIAVNVSAETPIFFDDEDESLISGALSWAPDLRVAPNTTVEVGSAQLASLPAEEAGFSQMRHFVVDELRTEGWLLGTVGLQTWDYRPNPAYSALFRESLEAAGATVIDGSDIMGDVRHIKSAREIEVIRRAGRIGDAGFRAAVAAVAEGVTELEIWAAATSAMAREGGELCAIPGMVNSGPKNQTWHRPAGRRRLRRGDVVNVDMCGVWDRYHCNLGRSLHFGTPPDSLAQAMARRQRVAEAVRAEMKVGMHFRDLLQLNERIATEEGIWQDQWWVGGYDFGIAFPPDWVGLHEFSSEIDPGEATIEPGMVMNHEWIFYMPQGSGLGGIIDTWIATEKGIEWPHQVGYELVVIE